MAWRIFRHSILGKLASWVVWPVRINSTTPRSIVWLNHRVHSFFEIYTCLTGHFILPSVEQRRRLLDSYRNYLFHIRLWNSSIIFCASIPHQTIKKIWLTIFYILVLLVRPYAETSIDGADFDLGISQIFLLFVSFHPSRVHSQLINPCSGWPCSQKLFLYLNYFKGCRQLSGIQFHFIW